jgi:acetylornithine deacetylase/succinyl-diaminopimelate desuccinylase-like protein
MTKTGRLLRELIALPSVNPAFLSPNDPHTGEQQVGQFLGALARRAGLTVEFKPVFPRRPNLLARLSPAGRVRQRVLLAPHLDTVGWAEAPGSLFRPERRNGRLFGRGACDTKGSAAAMMQALVEVAGARRRPAQTEIVFAGLVDEEYLQAGSRSLAASRFKAGFAIVGEPTSLKVVTAHKGVIWLELRTRGREAHGARPELGRNAVFEMAQVVDALLTEYAEGLRRRRHPLLGPATVNVGSICGGKQPNIVPAECICTVDRRTLPGESDAQVMRDVAGLLRRRHLRARMRKIQGAPCLPLETSSRLPLVQRLLALTGQRRPDRADFFSDAGVLSHAGIPSVLFGPGDIAQAHKPDEWISLDQLEQAKDLLRQFLLSLP